MAHNMDEERRELAQARSRRAAEKAGELLVHYMQTVWEAAGLTWCEDNDAECREIVDLIIEAAESAV